ncbi:MAG: beta-galactosidase [Clostridia bacterium]|nr:beta-galactosidase [Clostridia bacterium]
MYKIKDGILHKNEKKVFALGESYYPSFHPCKFPVPPEKDRIGEMKKDLAMMAKLGFNHVRFAALGEVALREDGSVCVDTPFIDAMTEEAHKNGISVSVREQGFAVNLRGFENVAMIDWNGAPQETVWSDFIRTTLHHEGILEDNRIYARALARHYEKFPNMVAFQIYNEPHYPGKGIYDYHEETVKAYRRWLVEKDVLTESEAKSYTPPRSRGEQSDRMWALWRIFARDSLTDFLNNASEGSRSGSSLPTYTCFTDDQIARRAAYRGCDLFANARSMDIVGYTCYLHGRGVDYYPMCLLTDIVQCAAELEGKESWCIELDSRTYIPIPLYNRSTYTVIGSGAKGIVYYQWRGDCPVEGVPHPNSCGLLNYDGTKTHNFENGANVNRYIISMNDLIMNAHRAHDGVGLLHSDYAIYLCDARENGDRQRLNEQLHNSYLLEYTEMHRQLRAAGYNVTLTDADHLDENKLGIKVLYVPHTDMLSPEEQAAVDRFAERGGEVYTVAYTYWDTAGMGYKKYEKRVKPYKERAMEITNTVYDVADITGVRPRVVPLDPYIGTQLLEGDGYYLIVITALSTARDTVTARVRVNIPFSSAEFHAIDGEKDICLKGNELIIEGVTDGGIIVLKP